MFSKLHLRSLRSIIAAILCLAFLLTCASCASAQGKQSKEPAPTVITSTETTSTSSPFVTNLTKDGTGLVFDVPAAFFNITKPSSMGSDFDIRWLDCTKYLDAAQTKNFFEKIPNVTFNNKTVFPPNLPAGYDPKAILEAGKNPGLGVAALHSAGITGKGVSIAIMDQKLFTGHPEYKDNLALYEEIHILPDEQASMHGSAVSSIAVGKTCGVAPDARLYYWAVDLSKTEHITSAEDKNIAFADGLAASIDRMLAVNAKLPEGQKIRVLSISRGFDDMKDDGVQAFMKAIKRAEAAGMFVITTSTYRYSDFMIQETDFGGLGKADFSGNPDDLSTYTLGSWEQAEPSIFINSLLVPMDGRTTADFMGADDYVFYSSGGFSWVAPYLAGLYALSVQVKPGVTPAEFWKSALDTANKLTVKIGDSSYTFNHVINPKALIGSLK